MSKQEFWDGIRWIAFAAILFLLFNSCDVDWKKTLHNWGVETKWYRPIVRRMSRRTPKLKEGQVAVKIAMEIPDAIFRPPQVPVQITNHNIIRPLPTAKQV